MSQPEPPDAQKVEPAEPEEEGKEKSEGGSRELSAEEQMAAYEESLKETDWGHQPC